MYKRTKKQIKLFQPIGNNISPIIYRSYYIQQLQMLYSILLYNHRICIHLNNQIYQTNELIYFGRLEYKLILNQQETWYKLHCNVVNYLISNIWSFIDTIDNTYFPGIDFHYDSSFRNITMLFELIQIIINKL